MKQHRTHRIHRNIGALALAASVATLYAGPAAPVPMDKAPPPPPPKEEDLCDKIWSIFTLYKNKENPVIQEFAITGRYQGQYAYLDSDQGDHDEWDNRRFRLGARMILFHDFELKAEMFGDLNSEGDFYEGFTEIWAAWKPSDAFVLTVGKQKPRFSLDWSTSSREILTFERNILINNFGIDYETGISMAGKSGNWTWYAAATNNDVGDTGEELEFGDLGGGWSFITHAGYDFKDSLGVDKAVLRADFIHSEHDESDDLLARFDNAVAASFNYKQGKVGVITEALYGEGDAGDAWGIYVTPSYDFTKRLQVVGRYTYAHSGDDALRAQRRYERSAPDLTDGGNGEDYHAGYVGLNYYICGHRLKLMTGIEYANMDGGGDGGDFDGWTWMSGVRIYW